MVFTESLGLVAGALVTCSMIPQLTRVFKMKSAHEISILIYHIAFTWYALLASLRHLSRAPSCYFVECYWSSSSYFTYVFKT